MTILTVNGEAILNDLGQATGWAANIGDSGVGSYAEQRGTLMRDMSQAIADSWETFKGWFTR